MQKVVWTSKDTCSAAEDVSMSMPVLRDDGAEAEQMSRIQRMTYWLAATMKWLWIAACLSVLGATLFFFGTEGNSDVDIVMLYLMWGLSFPLGGLWLFACGGGVFNHVGVVVAWLGFFVLGYLQWFKLLPALVLKVKQWRRKRLQKDEKPKGDVNAATV